MKTTAVTKNSGGEYEQQWIIEVERRLERYRNYGY